MIKATLPVNEEDRLTDLESYRIIDSRPEADFDELVELAGQICKCPISLISLLDKDRQWFKARKGLNVPETSRDIAFCSHAILQDQIMEVEDTKLDDRFHDNPLVTGDPNIRFYAGAPIVSPTGHKLGTICVIDHNPNKLDPDQEHALELLSRQVTKLIDLRGKNLLIRKRTDEIIHLKSQAVTRIMQESLDGKKELAYQLHEDLAQEIAACKINFNLLYKHLDKKEPLFLQVNDQLQLILEKTRDLSYTLIPAASNWTPLPELIAEYIDKVNCTLPFAVSFSFAGEEDDRPSKQTLVFMQIIEKWISFLSEKRMPEKLSLTLTRNSHYKLHMEHHQACSSLQELERDVNDCLLHEIARIENGRLDYSVTASGINRVELILP